MAECDMPSLNPDYAIMEAWLSFHDVTCTNTVIVNEASKPAQCPAEGSRPSRGTSG